MIQDENSFVDDLLKGLPKAPPRTKMEQLRMEKFIDEQIATLKAERTQAKSSVYVRFQTQFQLAAGFLVLVGGIAFAINFSSSNSTTNISSPKATPTQVNPSSSPTTAPENNSSSGSNANSGGGTSAGEVFGKETNPPSAMSNIASTGIDYLNSFSLAKAKIRPNLALISLGAMSKADRNCVINLGIDKVLAIDHAKYDSQKISAFYYENSASNLEVKIVDSLCTVLTVLN